MSGRRVRLMLLLLALCATSLAGQERYANPVLPGDHPDPSVIRVGDDYWATATTSQWAPIFPLLHSRDLVNWEQVGSVFETPPAWSSGSYWAPEIAQRGGRFFVYYTARRKAGPLCVAVATAARPEGPYTDHGPLVCQDVGSIDGALIEDENGRPYLLWKEDGNSQKRPTPIWAQRLAPSGTALMGRRRELLRNEAPWEAHLIEGPFVLRRGEWFYMFYSSDACCGRKCNYKLGVARSHALLGPWERHPRNPILAGNDDWKCPGHGSIVTTPDGRDFLLYHAYHPSDFQFAGRQGVLDEISWGADGWPTINQGRGPSGKATLPVGVAPRETERVFADELTGPALRRGWQWPWSRMPDYRFVAGSVVLRAPASAEGSATAAIIARPALTGHYTATARIIPGNEQDDTMAGLAAYGDAGNSTGISVRGRRVVLWMRTKGDQRELASAEIAAGPVVHVRMTASDGHRFAFAYSSNGHDWHTLGDEAEGGHLPPWDLAVRVAMAVGGKPGGEGRFDWMRIEAQTDAGPR
jgi:xylan 1,4-beta-xylosidase